MVIVALKCHLNHPNKSPRNNNSSVRGANIQALRMIKTHPTESTKGSRDISLAWRTACSSVSGNDPITGRRIR